MTVECKIYHKSKTKAEFIFSKETTFDRPINGENVFSRKETAMSFLCEKRSGFVRLKLEIEFSDDSTGRNFDVLARSINFQSPERTTKFYEDKVQDGD